MFLRELLEDAMTPKNLTRFLCIFLFFALLLLTSPGWVKAQQGQGAVVGNIYAADGTTPLEGAVVKVKNVSTGTVYESELTDRQGFFTIPNMEKGVYAFGISSPQGDFECESMVGIEPNKTSRISVSVSPYEESVSSAIEEVYTSQNEDGEALVGRVVSYEPVTRIAEFYIFKGFLQSIDEVHILGTSTDFHQNVLNMTMGQQLVERTYAGQTGYMEMEYDVVPGDLIYVVCEKGFSPFFLSPIGIAAIVAGSAAIIYGITELVKEPEEVSTFRK
jgi:hypothetical protein